MSNGRSAATDDPMTPQGLLRAAVKQVPAVRYALGVGGIAATVAIVLTAWKLEPVVAVFGTLIVMVFMVVLVVFAALSRAAPAQLRPAALFLAWAFLILMVSVATLFVSCAFFDRPKTLPCLLKGECTPDKSDAPESPKPISRGADGSGRVLAPPPAPAHIKPTPLADPCKGPWEKRPLNCTGP